MKNVAAYIISTYSESMSEINMINDTTLAISFKRTLDLNAIYKDICKKFDSKDSYIYGEIEFGKPKLLLQKVLRAKQIKNEP